jgi:hypothetical protein
MFDKTTDSVILVLLCASVFCFVGKITLKNASKELDRLECQFQTTEVRHRTNVFSWIWLGGLTMVFISLLLAVTCLLTLLQQVT